MSDRLSNEHDHDVSKKATPEHEAPDGSAAAPSEKTGGAPAPNVIPSNEGGMADTVHDHTHH